MCMVCRHMCQAMYMCSRHDGNNDDLHIMQHKNTHMIHTEIIWKGHLNIWIGCGNLVSFCSISILGQWYRTVSWILFQGKPLFPQANTMAAKTGHPQPRYGYSFLSDDQINSLFPSYGTCHRRSCSSMAWLMACCPMTPSHYMNQTINKVRWYQFQGNGYLNTQDINAYIYTC